MAKKKNTTKSTAKRSSQAKRTTPTTKKKSSSKKRTNSASSASGKKKAVRNSASKKKTSSEHVDEEVTLDRRRKADRRVDDSGKGSTTTLERRKKVQRRRQIDPTTCERDYSVDEVEFMNAMDDYKRKSGRMFPTCSEILEVVRSMGYVKQSSAEQAATTEVQDFERISKQTDEANSELVGVGFNDPAMQASEESVSWCI